MSKRLIVSFSVALALMALCVAQIKDAPKEWTPELMMKVKGVGNVQVSPDGKRVVFTVTEPVMEGEKSENLTHIHIANTDGTGAFQLTYGDKSCTNPRWSPDGELIAFTSERSGKNNIWLIRARGGEAWQLTDVKTEVLNFKWSPDGKQIAFVMPDPPTEEEEKAKKEKNDPKVVDEDIKMNHLWVIPVDVDGASKPSARQLTRGKFSVSGLFAGGFDWSPDGKAIAFTRTPTPKVDDWTKADISLVDVSSGAIQTLVKTGAAEFNPLYSPDGRWIAYVASDDPPTWGRDMTVRVIASGGGQSRELAETFDRQPDVLGWSADGTQLYFTETRGTLVLLYALPVDGRPPRIVSETGVDVISGAAINASRTWVGFVAQGTDRPQEAYVSRLDRFSPVRVSRANADLPQLPLGRTEVIRWKSVDGLEIEGLLTYPVNYEHGKRYPLLLIIHGGPAGVFLQTFTANPTVYPIAAFAARGYAILRPNVRGSSGYGKSFRYANYKDWGGMDYKDLMAGVDNVINMGVADPERLGVMGWSYGGFMTSWVITQTKRFKAASVGAGVTNLMSFNGTTDIPSFVPDYFGAEFWDDLDVYRAHSAMFNIKGVSTPTLIQHGEKDERVPLSQGLELYNALKRQGCAVKMVIYPRTPHGPREPKLLLDIARRNMEWFDRYVRSSEPNVAN